MTKLIYYGVRKPERAKKLLDTAETYNIELREVLDEELGELLGYFAGLEGYEKTNASEEAIDEELLVFVDFPSNLLQQFLLDLRALGETFPHKAAMTETTKDWSFSRLIRHIERENAVVQAWAELLPVVKESLEKQKKSPTDARAKAIDWARKLRLKGEDMEESDVREAIRRLKEAN